MSVESSISRPASRPVRILATGDLVLERADSAPLLAPAAPLLREADLTIGQLEVPHTDATATESTDVPALPAPPSALDGVAEAGFDVLTLAGNHVYDFGARGLEDTLRHCRARGLRTAGAGADIEAARSPAVVEVEGTTVAVLSVNCVGPRESAATSRKPGAAAVEVITHYTPRGANPGGPPRVHTFADPDALRAFRGWVEQAADASDVLVVALHKGLVHTRASIAAYEYELAHTAIDAGASAVIAHHAHILRGVEVYRDRPIFHGLGNFATVTKALSGAPGDARERVEWAGARKRLFGFEPDPAMPDYPFHPESRHTMIARIDVAADGVVDAGFVPCWIDDEARPVPLDEEHGAAVVDYVREITREAGLKTTYTWVGDRVRVGAAA